MTQLPPDSVADNMKRSRDDTNGDDSESEVNLEKAAMEKTHTFQNNMIVLDVGGHRFTTSRQTLTSIPNTYLESMFSGRYELTPNIDGTYFIDRDGTHFRHILNVFRQAGTTKLSLEVVEERHRNELRVEMEFYGLRPVGPYHAEEAIAQKILERACQIGTKLALQTAVAQAGVLVFEMGSSTHFLNQDFSNLIWVITDRWVNDAPVWVANDGRCFLFRNAHNMAVVTTCESECTDDSMMAHMYNAEVSGIFAPTELGSGSWVASPRAVWGSVYASTERLATTNGEETPWVIVPAMVTIPLYGLNNETPEMEEALKKLAALL